MGNSDFSHLGNLLVKNCEALIRSIPNNTTIPSHAAPSAWKSICLNIIADSDRFLLEKSDINIQVFLETNFQPWILVDENEKIASNIMTAYYEAFLIGSRFKNEEFKWPLYGVPDDLLTIDLGLVYPELIGKRIRGKLEGKKVVPYDSREMIQNFRKDIPVIIWTNDPIDNLFFQIQGSGKILIIDETDFGKIVRLSYANHNGQPYRSIGKWLAESGEISILQASVKNIRFWVQNHPERLLEMLNINPSMVFFKEEEIINFELGPIGAYGIPLTPGRSIAVDTNFIPLGTPVFISEIKNNANDFFSRLVFAQDTGSVIKGAARADLYLGFGKKVEDEANNMKKNIRMWVLWPKESGEPSAK
ncbi:MAG: MltA domain-containing protein [Bordetella sp.]|nr:MAG: MltA domain-containing protein [Bordetella sp.]